LTAAVIKLGCPTIGVTSDTLRHLEVAAVLQKIGDPGCAERMV
jgi:hypothetical protein